MALKSKKFKRNLRVIAYALALLSVSAVPGLPKHAYALTNPATGSTGLQAQIPADPPKIAPSITTPSNGQTITNLPLKVSGLCASDTLLVKVFKNGVFGGSAQCANGSYTILIDLFNGKNDLVSRVYDALDQTGPDSVTVTVTFVESGFNNTVPRVTITSDYAKRGANPGDTLTWPILISGGTAPYAISVEWGDGSNELISRSFNGSFDISHIYKTSGVYRILLKITDSTGQSAFLQLVGVGNGALAQDNQNTAGGTTTRTMVVWWPVLIALVFVVVSFWLGGRHKLETLRRQAEKRIQY